MDKTTIALGLYNIGAVKFGEFTLSSGKKSPFYIDLRILPSFPSVFKQVAEAYIDLIKKEQLQVSMIAGIAVGGLPIATLVSYMLGKPMVYVRKPKQHGTKSIIEGVIRDKSNIVLLDDIATTGGSLLQAADKLREAGVNINHAIVLIDREQGATERLTNAGIKLHAYMNITELFSILKRENKIDDETFEHVIHYLERGD